MPVRLVQVGFEIIKQQEEAPFIQGGHHVMWSVQKDDRRLKLLVALLTERMQRYARAFSPWGTRWFDQDAPEESLA